MAQLTEEAGGRPFPPGDYPVVVVGSGPGALQLSYSLRALGLRHAVLSAEDRPGGMFRRFPLFQRLISWTKPYAPAERGTRAYQRYDWNSLIGDQPGHRALVAEFMDGTSEFPARAEMERALVAFRERAGLAIRHGCRWEGTRSTEGGFALATGDGEYRCRVVVFAVGATQPWKPAIPGLEAVPHYAETGEARRYAGQRVFVIGKRNSGFEIADGLLPWARQLFLASPRPARISVVTNSTAGARARYLQPYEDHVLGGGGVFVLDAAIERVERVEGGYRVHTKGTTVPGDMVFDVDQVIAATGFGAPLGDLPALGVATFSQGRLPAQTPFWESASLPGVYFAGSVTQAAAGMKKHGIPSNSAAVQGFRYNARVLAEHLAARLGRPLARPPVDPGGVADFLLAEAAHGPELWNQPSYLCRVVSFDPDRGATDDGIAPLAHFVDAPGPDAVAVAVEPDGTGDIHPVVYVRRGGRVEEHVLPSDPLHRYETAEHRRALLAVLGGLVR